MHGVLQFLQAVSTDSALVIYELVDNRACLEKVADNLRSGKVVVHGVIALLTEFRHHLLGFCVALGRSLHALQVVDGIEQLL